MSPEILEIYTFLFTFLLLIIYFIPSQSFFLIYDKKHFYKYKYIINVIYDLISIILIPTGLNLLSKQFLDIHSLALFLGCIILFLIVAGFRYKIEKVYDKLADNIHLDNDSSIYSKNNWVSQLILQLYLIYAFAVPANLILNNFMTEKYKKYLFWIIFSYIAWIIFATMVSHMRKVNVLFHKIILKIRESKWGKIFLFLYSFVFLELYELSMNLRIYSVSLSLVDIILGIISVYFCQLIYSRSFILHCDGDYEQIYRNIFGIYNDTKLTFDIFLNKDEKLLVKFLGCLTPLQLLKIRLKNNRSNIFKKIGKEKNLKMLIKDKDIASFQLSMNDVIVSKSNNNKLHFLVLIDESGNLIYQPVIFLFRK